MNYTIYKNIQVKDFDSMKHKINQVEKDVSLIMLEQGFVLSKKYHLEHLGLSYNKKGEDGINGNIGFNYDDNIGEPTFTFYSLKSYDIDNIRYFKKEEIYKNKNFTETINNISQYFNTAIKLYNSWTKLDLENSR